MMGDIVGSRKSSVAAAIGRGIGFMLTLTALSSPAAWADDFCGSAKIARYKSSGASRIIDSRSVANVKEYISNQTLRYYPLTGYDNALNSMIRDRDPLVDEGVIIGAAKGLAFDLHGKKWVDEDGAYKELAAGQKLAVLCLESGDMATLENSDTDPKTHPRRFVVGKVSSQFVLLNKSDFDTGKVNK